MDRQTLLLIEALRAGAGQTEVRLYRSGRLAGLFEARTRDCAAAAERALRDGLLEVVRVQTRGKAVVEWVRVTQSGLDFLLHHESPLRAIDELRDTLALNQDGVPRWVAELRRSVEAMQQKLHVEVEAIGRRLDALTAQASEAITRLEQERAGDAPDEAPWAPQVLAYLDERTQAGLGARCPLAELFAALTARRFDLSLRDFHVGLRRLHDRGSLRLAGAEPGTAAPAPEYALLDGSAVYHYAALPAAA